MASTKVMTESVIFLFDPVGDNRNPFAIGFQGPEVVFVAFYYEVQRMSPREAKKYNSIGALAKLLDTLYRQQNLAKPFTYQVTRSGKVYGVTVGCKRKWEWLRGVGPSVKDLKGSVLISCDGDEEEQAKCKEMKAYLEKKFKERTPPGEKRPVMSEQEAQAMLKEAYERFGLRQPGAVCSV